MAEKGIELTGITPKEGGDASETEPFIPGKEKEKSTDEVGSTPLNTSGGGDAPATQPEISDIENRQKSSKQPSPTLTEFKNYITTNKLFSSCIVVDAILIISIFAVTIAWLNFANTTIVDYDPSPNLYCMKCDNVDPKKKDEYFPKAIDDCCASKDGKYLEYILNKYVEQTINETYREKPLFQLCLNASTAVETKAYAQIASISNTDTDKNNLHLIKWDETAISNQSDPLVAFFKKVTYQNGNFKVQRPGYYHIYSRLVFDLKTEVVPFPAVIRHLVLKYRKDYNVGEKLLEGYATQCDAVTDTKFSSLVFGDFFLTDTDKVQVLLNDPKYIDAKMSYFGMYLI